MVIPLPDLRDFGVEATDVLVHQVVAVVAAIIVECLGDLALGFAGDIAPHPAAFGGQLRRHRAVSVDGVAAVDKKVGQAQTHGFVDAHAANVRVDAEALANGVAAPDKTEVAPGLRHAAQMTEPGFAGDTALGVFEIHAIENRLIGRQPRELDPCGEIATRIGQWRDESAWVAKQAAGVPFDHHPRRSVAAAPDHRPIAHQIAGLHAIGELRTVLDRGDDGRRQPWKQ